MTCPEKLRHVANVIERLGVEPIGSSHSDCQLTAEDFKLAFGGEKVTQEFERDGCFWRTTVDSVNFFAWEPECGQCSNSQAVTLPRITTEECMG